MEQMEKVNTVIGCILSWKGQMLFDINMFYIKKDWYLVDIVGLRENWGKWTKEY